MTTCPSAELLADWLNENLSEQDSQAVGQHVDGCRSCQDRLEAQTRGSESFRLHEMADPHGDAASPPLLLAMRRGRQAPHSGAASATDVQSGTADQVAAADLPQVPGYDVLAELGRGGMGVVYRARQCALNRVVALKMVLAGARADAEELARFRAEAEALGRLQHPHIVQVFEVGTSAGRPFFAMEYVGGGSLAQHLGGQPQPAAPAAALVETLARAMHVAHGRGIIHRDLKPANILLHKDEGVRSEAIGENASNSPSSLLTPHSFTPKISDFGLAKRIDLDQGLTRTGNVMGTPSYLAPEQAMGLGKDVGVATDVHALGTILYELLTGRPPFLGVSVHETLDLVRHKEPVPPRQLQPRIPRDLETICLKCLHKEPSRRYAAAEALALDLRRHLDGQPIQARPVRPWERGWRWARRNPVLAAATALCIGLLVTIAVGSSIMAALLQIERGNVRAERAQRQQTVIESVLDVLPAGLPVLLAEMNERRDVFLPLLQAHGADAVLKPNQRMRLAMALTSLGEDCIDELVGAVATAPAGEGANLAAAIRAKPERGFPALRQAFGRADGTARFRLAVLLLELGDVEAARQFLAFRADPEPRTRFIRQFAGWHGGLTTLANVLHNHEDSALRSGLCAAIGRLDPESLAPAVRTNLRDLLAHLYRQASDGATHGTSGWALRTWGQELPVLEPRDHCPADQDWFVTREGLTLVRAEAPRPRGQKKHPWPLFVADREVSVSLFRRFLDDPKLADHEKPTDWPGVDLSISPTNDCPVHNVNLLDIMLFCNWLSRREGRTACYRPVPDKPGYWTCEIAADGYRLPSGPEWGHSCRAGVATMFPFGEDATFLPDYASVLFPRAEPGGKHLPNDWGLFDMLANTWDIALKPPPRRAPFDPAATTVVLCGGTYGIGGFYSKSETRADSSGGRRNNSIGFRVVLRAGVPAEADAPWLELDIADRLVEQIARAIDERPLRLERFAGFDRLQKADPTFVAAVARTDDHKAWLQRSFRAAVLQRRWDKATQYYTGLVELFPRDNLRECQWVILLADDPAYPEICRQLIERWSASTQWSELSHVAKACSLSGTPRDQAVRLADLAERGARLVESADIPDREFRKGYCAWVAALALYRADRHDEVLGRCAVAQAAPKMPAQLKFANHLVRALALQRLGRPGEAQAAFDQALAIQLPREGTNPFLASWSDFLVVKLLLREASSVLGRPALEYDDLPGQRSNKKGRE